MPYIKKELRDVLDPHINNLIDAIIGIGPCTRVNAGVFNYVFTKLAADFPIERTYGNLSALRAAMNDASMEFYHRVMRPLEDEKLAENGDVYPPRHTNDPTACVILDRSKILNLRTTKGGFTQQTVEALHTTWPPREGWIDTLIGFRMSQKRYFEIYSKKDETKHGSGKE